MFRLFAPKPAPTQITAEDRAKRQADLIKAAEERLRPRIKKEDFGFPISVGHRYQFAVEATLRRKSGEYFHVVLDTNSNGAYVLRYGHHGISNQAALSFPGAESRETTLLIAAALGISIHRQLAARMANHDRREMFRLRDDLDDYRQIFREFAAEERFEFVASILKTKYSQEAREAIAAFRAELDI